jgi:hypothetical protein
VSQPVLDAIRQIDRGFEPMARQDEVWMPEPRVHDLDPYELDPAGNRTAVTTRLGTVSYRHDDLNRLTGACWASGARRRAPQRAASL